MRWTSRWRERIEWRRWFAWHPIEIGGTSIWLEWVERRQVGLMLPRIGHSAWWQHRIIGTAGPDLPTVVYPPPPPRKR